MLKSTTARTPYLWVIGAILLACFFYLTNIQGVSFWEDEAWLARAISRDAAYVWTFATENGVHPPLYFYLSWVFAPFTGNSEIALRLVSALIGVLAVAMTYRLGTDLVNHRAGVYAAYLLAGSIYLINVARLARHYTLFVLLALLLVWVYWRWLHRSSSRRWWLALVIIQAALLYTHYFGIWLALVVGWHGLMFLRGRARWHLLGGLLLSGILFLPWLPSILYQFNASGGGLSYATTDPIAAIFNYRDRISNANLAFLLLIPVGLYGIWKYGNRRASTLLLIWLVAPLLLILLFNSRFTWFIGRNMLFTIGGMMILYGAGLAWLARSRFGQFLAVLVIGLFIAHGAWIYNTFWHRTHDWRTMAQHIAAEARSDDIFVLEGEQYSLDYYLQRYLGEKLTFQDMDVWEDDPVLGERIWLIDTRWAVEEDLVEVLPPDMVQTRRFVVLPLVTEFYQMPADDATTTFDEQIALAHEQPDDMPLTAGDTLTLDLWWQALRLPDADYSVSLALVDENGILVQQDGGFDDGRIPAQQLPLDQWIPDSRTLTVPIDAPAGTYTLVVTIYDWQTGERLPVEGGDSDNLYPLFEVTLN